MRHVGVREFRDKATTYLSGGEILTVERHGKPIGYYIPIHHADEEETRRALDEFETAVQQFLDATGITREELADALDLSKRS